MYDLIAIEKNKEKWQIVDRISNAHEQRVLFMAEKEPSSENPHIITGEADGYIKMWQIYDKKINRSAFDNAEIR